MGNSCLLVAVGRGGSAVFGGRHPFYIVGHRKREAGIPGLARGRGGHHKGEGCWGSTVSPKNSVQNLDVKELCKIIVKIISCFHWISLPVQ